MLMRKLEYYKLGKSLGQAKMKFVVGASCSLVNRKGKLKLLVQKNKFIPITNLQERQLEARTTKK